ncbi:MAG TPA: DUF3280 domain-containing protein [Xanthobacteraceae bacterium]|nr:DUF3280 domain-containing protein [Xanthobacteraceae bacterium]
MRLNDKVAWRCSSPPMRERNMTALGFDDPGICRRTLERIGLVASLAALTVLAIQPCEAAEPVKIAVFDFELNDASAGGGMIGQDAIDTEHLRESTEQARRMLSASGRYSILDTSSVAGEVDSAGGIQRCNGCDGPLARKLGADQSMVGVVTRVNRTEYTMQILVRDAESGAVVSNNFTGLRMGANYAWPRGVKWLMDNRILSAPRVP